MWWSAEPGSPLHVRGRPARQAQPRRFDRITPACAGKTEEHQTRITPACAGKASAPAVAATKPQDHPRVCGEDHDEQSATLAAIGSPPRVRGRHALLGTVTELYRITPACVGKTDPTLRAVSSATDHPRRLQFWFTPSIGSIW